MRAILAPALAMSLALIGDQMLYVVLPSRPEAAGVGVAALGIILSANRFIRLAANSASGVLYDQLGRRQPYLLGMALALASTAGYLLASSFWPLLAARLVWGTAFSLLSVGGLAIVLDLAGEGARGRSVGLYQSLVQCGTLLGLVLSGILYDRIGYRGTLAVYVPLTALGVIIAAVAVRETARAPRSAGEVLRARRTRDARADSPRPAPKPVVSLRGLDPSLLAPMYASFAVNLAGSGILMATLGMYVKDAVRAGSLMIPVASLTGLLLASRRLAGMIFAPVAGHLSDRLGRRAVARAGTLATLAGFVVLAATDWGLVTVVIGVGLTAAGEGISHPALVAWVGDAAPADRRGITMGLLATAYDLGAAVGPVIAYALAATVGLGVAYSLAVAVMASAALSLARPDITR